MAPANLDLVRSIFADWERGDFGSADWAHPQIRLEVVGGTSEANFSGLTEMAAGFRGFVTAWEEYRVEADEIRALDDARVLALTHDAGRGKASGLEIAPIGSARAFVFDIVEYKVTKLVVYWDRDRALADLGLSPKLGPPRS
jgi:ketosteroid isomerase-like protein